MDPRAEEGIKIIQDPKILQQIFKAVPADGKSQNTVIMIGQLNNQTNENFELMAFLHSLPEPRMKSLKLKIIGVARNFFRSDKEVAAFLGISIEQLKPYYETRKVCHKELINGNNE
jgi:hypothetical protein